MHGVIVHDASYFQTLELKGTLQHLTVVLSMFCDPAMVAPYSKRYIGGLRECPVDLYESQMYPGGYIGPASITWNTQPVVQVTDSPLESKNNAAVRQLLLRFHPSILGAVANTVEKSILAAHARQSKIVPTFNSRSDQSSVSTTSSQFRSFCVFEITGPMATDVIKACLSPVAGTSKPKLAIWKALVPPAAVPSGTIISLDVQDPRLKWVESDFAICVARY